MHSNFNYKHINLNPSEAIAETIDVLAKLSNSLEENIKTSKASAASIERNFGMLERLKWAMQLQLLVQYQFPPHLMDKLSEIIADIKQLEQESAGQIYLHKNRPAQAFTPNHLFKQYEIFLEPAFI